MTNAPPFAPIRPRRVVFVAYAHHQPLDLVGPLQVFALANREGASPPYEIVIAAEQPGRVDSASGPSFLVEHGLEALVDADTVVIPGGPGMDADILGMAVVPALTKAARTARRICAVCTGAFLLARAGALAGRKATTHWRSCADLAARHPEIDVLVDHIYVRDGSVWTSAGMTAGIDMALALVEEDHGQAMAARLARNLVVYLRRPGGQAQFSEPLALQQQSRPGRYGALMEKVAASLRQPWTVPEMAAAAGQSARTFQRHFTEIAGQSPAAAVEVLRVSRARTMLETTGAANAVVAARCGFGTEEQMRRAFHRRFGVPPGAIRDFFGCKT